MDDLNRVLSDLTIFVGNSAGLAKITDDLSVDDIVWVIKNRIYAETERYVKKNDMQDELASPHETKIRIEQSKKLFIEYDLELACYHFFVSMLDNLMKMDELYTDACIYIDDDLVNYVKFWEKAVLLSNIDNADAMCFSSDTWDFYIFDIFLSRLSDLFGPEVILDKGFLTANEQDIRTRVHALQLACTQKQAISFITDWIRSGDLIRPDGIVNFFLLRDDVACDAQSLAHKPLVKSEMRMNSEALKIYGLYRMLYKSRILYDSYEYFGRYAFLRHVMILKTLKYLKKTSCKQINDFRFFASTYQYSKALTLLTNLL